MSFASLTPVTASSAISPVAIVPSVIALDLIVSIEPLTTPYDTVAPLFETTTHPIVFAYTNITVSFTSEKQSLYRLQKLLE